MLYNSFQISAKAAAVRLQEFLQKTAKDNETLSSIPWVIPCNTNIHSALSLDGSSGNFCRMCGHKQIKILGHRQIKILVLLKSQNQVLLLTAPYLTRCTGLEEEGAATWAQIPARHTADYSVLSPTRALRSEGSPGAGDTSSSPQRPKLRGGFRPPVATATLTWQHIKSTCQTSSSR